MDGDTFANLGRQTVGIVTAIIGVAIVAVILSNGAQTVNVIATFFGGLTSLLGVVISPVTPGSNFITGQNSLTGGQSTYAGEAQIGLLPGDYGYSYANPYGGGAGSGYGPNAALNTANQAIGVANSAVNLAGAVAPAFEGA